MGKTLIHYEYKDAVFELKWNESWNGKIYSYYIVGLRQHGEVLELPETYQQYPVTGSYFLGERTWSNREKKDHMQYPGVRKLVVPKTIETLDMDNLTFPELQEIVIDPENQRYQTDGKMLFEYNRNKKLELKLALCAGMQSEKVIVPADIAEVVDGAFAHTKCTEVEYESASTGVSSEAFRDSEWQKTQGDVVYIGTTLYKVKKTFEEEVLRVKEGTRRFDAKAFQNRLPDKLITPVIPSNQALKGRWGEIAGFQEIVITSVGMKVNFNTLRQWEKLQAVRFQEHRLFRDEDGVVFSKDGKTLFFFPPNKEIKQYTIPKGVITIGRLAFSEQKYLEEIDMADSVKTMQQGAFYHCHALKKIRISESVIEILDANLFSPLGMFEGCRRLCEVILPAKLQYIGSHAFMGTALQTLEIPEKVRQIGEYALAAENLQTVNLPKSCHIVGKGALMYAKEIMAYEGSARGLISAVEAVPRGINDKLANLDWHEAMIYMRNSRGDRTDTIWIPESMQHTAASFVDIAWNGEKFDYDEYYNCFSKIQNTQEKLEFATIAAKRLKDVQGTEFEVYFRHTAKRIAERLIEKHEEKGLIDFLKEDYLTEAALKGLLKKCNEASMTKAVAYILKKGEKHGKGNRKTTAIRI